MHERNHTHDPAATSWVTGADGHPDFPLQNLPIARFRRHGSSEACRGGVAIGEQIVDLAAVSLTSVLSGHAHDAARLAGAETLDALMAAGPAAWRALRHGLFEVLAAAAPASKQTALAGCLVPQAGAEFARPTRIANYTDFYTSIHHARNVGRVVRPDNPLTPNFVWMPIAYHGRASSVVISGTPLRRPMGQSMKPGATAPAYGPCARLDWELELGFFVGQGNGLGEPITLADAERHIFGVCLLNDWSARDQQFWEMAPLGPFLGKNFCTSISPWIVMLEALAPYRVPAVQRVAPEPEPLPHLDTPGNRAAGGLDIQLRVCIESEQHRARGIDAAEVSRTSFRHQYWTLAQMVTQHTVGGCNLQSGDLVGTGTISGPTPAEAGAIVELSRGGTAPITLAGTGEQRAFLADGDEVILQGWCEAPGAARIGFGSCRGRVLPATGAA